MNFKNKKVLIFGLGRYKEGSGISATNFFIGQGAKVIVTDMKPKKDLEKSIKMIRGRAVFHLGGHKMEDVRWADLVMRNPGVPDNSPFIIEARRHGIPVMTDVSLFMQLAPCPIIGITGTRGKSTTTTLLGEILKSKNKKTFIGGNIQRSPLTFLKKLDDKSIVILELSSWLLESLNDIKQSPWASIVTNLYPDHLNVHGTMEEYSAAKQNIFKFQKPGDVLVLNYDNTWTRKMSLQYKNKRQIIWFSLKQLPKNKNGAYLSGNKLMLEDKEIIAVNKLKLKGEHNIANALAAASLASAIGVPIKNIASVLKKFEGISNRQEIIKIHKGVTWVNDTTATTPEAAIAALKRFGDAKKKNIVLISGGADKKLEFIEFAREIKKYCREVVLLDGTATPKLSKLLQATIYNLQPCKSMKEAVYAARSLVKKGDIVLLSPACASFGLFKNEFDRGEQFVKIVKRFR